MLYIETYTGTIRRGGRNEERERRYNRDADFSDIYDVLDFFPVFMTVDTPNVAVPMISDEH